MNRCILNFHVQINRFQTPAITICDAEQDGRMRAQRALNMAPVKDVETHIHEKLMTSWSRSFPKSPTENPTFLVDDFSYSSDYHKSGDASNCIGFDRCQTDLTSPGTPKIVISDAFTFDDAPICDNGNRGESIDESTDVCCMDNRVTSEQVLNDPPEITPTVSCVETHGVSQANSNDESTKRENGADASVIVVAERRSSDVRVPPILLTGPSLDSTRPNNNINTDSISTDEANLETCEKSLSNYPMCKRKFSSPGSLSIEPNISCMPNGLQFPLSPWM